MEQTAVEWFSDRIKHGGLVSNKQFDELLEQANKMFEKQKIKAQIKIIRKIGNNGQNAPLYGILKMTLAELEQELKSE